MTKLSKGFGFTRRAIWAVVLLLVLAAAFRVVVAHRWPNDAPDDGRAYAQMARNLLEQHVYSHATEPPYNPSFIRLPGYPLFVASIYSIFGHTNNGAVRIAQALIDAATCGLIAAIAFLWEPDEKRKQAAAIGALALAAVCPFTTIYAATILTEVPTNFLLMATFLSATLAFRKSFTTEDTEEEQRAKRSFAGSFKWWLLAGLLGGLGVFLRPDTGLFAAAVGLTLVIATIRSSVASRRATSLECADLSALSKAATSRRTPKTAHAKRLFSRMLLYGTVFSFAFILPLVPWTIRNWRVFHVFQPLSPAHGEMPGEFVARGYNLWLRTWLDDDIYIDTFEWSLDVDPIGIDDVPASAFDSADEKARVEALLDRYNSPANSQTPPSPTPQPSPTSPSSDEANQTNEASEENEPGDEEESESESEEPNGPVLLTPEIDAGFGQIARERIARHPIRHYVWLPIKRARTMWIDTHSQYWPFEGRLMPLEDLDHAHRQQIWLPLFAGLTALYTLLGLAGISRLWWSRLSEARTWVLLASLAILLRLVLFSSIENPEPRYLVEFFPFLSILGGVAIARLKPQRNADESR